MFIELLVHALHAFVFYNSSDQMAFDLGLNLSPLTDRGFIWTREGYLGLASALADVGDEIVVVKGGKVPLILRPEGAHWRLQGDCYVRGIMNGEAFREGDARLLWVV